MDSTLRREHRSEQLPCDARLLTYEEAVRWMRCQPALQSEVQAAYLDLDVLAAARRFAASDEFREVEVLLRLGQPGSQRTVLDVGCGNGVASFAFASRGHHVFAVDPDESDEVGLGAAIRIAKHVRVGAISPCRAFSEQLPFGDAVFDIVYTRQALHHFADLAVGLRECARVLKAGGTLLATREHVVRNAEDLRRFLANHILHRLHGGENAYPVHSYTQAFTAAGLRVRRVLGPFDTVVNYYPSAPEQIQGMARALLQRRLGNILAGMVASRPTLLRGYMRWRVLRDPCPGSLYTFLCLKSRLQ